MSGGSLVVPDTAIFEATIISESFEARGAVGHLGGWWATRVVDFERAWEVVELRSVSGE